MPRRHRGSRNGTVAFHALEAIHEAHAPVVLHELGAQINVIVAPPDTDVELALVALRPRPRNSGRRRHRRAQNHVLDGKGGYHHVVRLHRRRGDYESIGVHETRGHADGNRVHVVVDPEQKLVRVLILVGDVELGVEALVLGENLVPTELAGSLLGGTAADFGDHHLTLKAGRQVVEDSVHSIGLRGNELPGRVDTIGFDKDVFPGFQNRPDLVVDGYQRIGDVLAPGFAFDNRYLRAFIVILEQFLDVGGAHARVLRRRPWIDRRPLLLLCENQALSGGYGPRAGKKGSACG